MDNVFPVLLYPNDYDPHSEADVDEVKTRGYLSHARVKVNADNIYPVYFSDPIRLHQDMTKWGEQEKPCFAPVGLITIDEVTPVLMERAVQYLWKKNYFSFFTSVNNRAYEVLY